MFEVSSPFTIRVKPYRSGWLRHLVHLQFRTAFCALFGLTRWRIPERRPARLLDNWGLSFTPTAEQMQMARDAREALKGCAEGMSDIYADFIDAIRAQQKSGRLAMVPTISRAEAYQAYADAPGRSVAALTEAEKQTAFLNHVLEKLEGRP